MKGSALVLSKLNDVLTAELTSINQYFLHARIYKNWGLKALNDVCYKKSIKDMGKLRIGEDTPEMLQCDMDFQIEQLPLLRAAIALCEAEQDYVSRDMLTEILEYEEEHLDWLETQQHQISVMGLANYLQAQLGSE